MSQVELIIMQYAFKFNFNSRCQWGVACGLGAPDRKCRKPYRLPYQLEIHWKLKIVDRFYGIIENEPNEVSPLVRQLPIGLDPVPI